jgi:eukaryotic-like serine/threonine-protein kinase
MSDEKYERFGKYLILGHLVDGGMAKICRARFLGEQANKLMAVKMVQEQFSKDPEFVRMFQDELNVCFGLLHPNVAQTYDYGEYEGQLYTAMEMIEGANLKEYLDRLAEKKYVFPVDVSVYIISQVCQGLFYSHNYKDPLTQKPLNIIHRDISPHNIMLSYDGAVKVIDFGIAKAESNSEQTQAGTIKGKLSYLAPEYLEGLTLDVRYDEFAVGITLWELLCGRRLFQAKNDLACLKLIQQCKVPPPSSINPNVPKELDQIVLKALDKDRTLRYDDMDQLNRALVKFLYATYPDFNPTDLQHFATQLFKEEIASNETLYAEYGRIDIKPYLQDLKSEMSGEKRSSSSSSADAVVKGPAIQEFDFSSDDLVGLSLDGSPSVDGQATGGRRSPQQAAMDRTQTRKIKRSTTRTNTQLRNPNLKKTGTRTSIQRNKIIDQKTSSGGGAGKFAALIVASLAAVIYFKADMVSKMTGVDLSFISGKVKVASTDNPKAQDRSAASARTRGIVIINNIDAYMEVHINGERINYISGDNITVPISQKIRIKVSKKGYLPFTKSIVLSKSRPSFSIAVPELEIARIGLLSTSLNYNGSTMLITVNGEEIEEALPVKNMRIPAGNYEVKITNDLLGTEKKFQFKIQENKKFFLE